MYVKAASGQRGGALDERAFQAMLVPVGRLHHADVRLVFDYIVHEHGSRAVMHLWQWQAFVDRDDVRVQQLR